MSTKRCPREVVRAVASARMRYRMWARAVAKAKNPDARRILRARLGVQLDQAEQDVKFAVEMLRDGKCGAAANSAASAHQAMDTLSNWFRP